MIIDHIGIVVKDLEAGIAHWRDVFGYSQLTDVVVNKRQKVKVVFLEKKDSILIKLVTPLDKTSPVHAFARRGGGLHHLCFKCNNLEQELQRLKAHDLRVLVPPQPGEAFANENIAFLFAKMGLNIELIDTDKKAGLKVGREGVDAEPLAKGENTAQ